MAKKGYFKAGGKGRIQGRMRSYTTEYNGVNRETNGFDEEEKFVFRMSDRGPPVLRAVLGLLDGLIERERCEMQHIRQQVLKIIGSSRSTGDVGIVEEDDDSLMQETDEDGDELLRLKQRWADLVSHQKVLEKLASHDNDDITAIHKGKWREFDPAFDENGDFSIWWKTSRFRESEISAANAAIPFRSQRINHFPGGARMMTRKDGLVRCIRRLKVVYGSICDFIPESYILPNEYVKLMERMATEMRGGTVPEKNLPIWICKPSDLSRGRKIFLFRTVSEFVYDQSSVVQRYIENPSRYRMMERMHATSGWLTSLLSFFFALLDYQVLIAGYKFDLRIYVLVTSYHPLRIYMYRDGLVRFSTKRYNVDDLDNLFAHLTNASINKYSPDYSVNKSGIGDGAKWNFSRFKRFIDHQYGEAYWQNCWSRIEQLIILTMAGFANDVPADTQSCFELYGIDVIIDQNWKPFLLEVNFSPSLGCDCEVDISVKKPLLSDTINVLQLTRFVKTSRRQDRRPARGMKKRWSNQTKASSNSDTYTTPDPNHLGNFDCIFPFNAATQDASVLLSCRQRQQGSMKKIIHHLKAKGKAEANCQTAFDAVV